MVSPNTSDLIVLHAGPLNAWPNIGSMSAGTIGGCLASMKAKYQADPVAAVRGQGFIKELHQFLANQFDALLLPAARRQGITVEQEATLFGSHKPKDVDVAVMHPVNGPLLVVGVRSQMSSVGKNVLTYYQDIVGECISLQDRFPLATYGYAYLHPLKEPEGLSVDHKRYSRMYGSISGRDGRNYRDVKGVYDQFAYLIVDFDSDPPGLRDDLLTTDDGLDLSISTFVPRMISTFKRRNIWLDVFA